MAILVHKSHGKILPAHDSIHSFQNGPSVDRLTISPVRANKRLCVLHAESTTTTHTFAACKLA
ncbi:MAG: hypothetical protein SWQ30_10805 [Thermodesulfobacteriota bacterium]|nr:hypothetical protein [Thermodesulfobacteriota bacterium]